MKYGDYILTPDGQSFTYIEPYEGSGFDAICREAAEYDPFKHWQNASHSHDDIWYVWLDDCKIVPKDDPSLFIGMHI